MHYYHDEPCMPGTGETPAQRLSSAAPVAGTVGAAYLSRRKVSPDVAHAAGVRFDADFLGRPALVAPLVNRSGEVVSLHGRYLAVARGESKMFTFGPGGGVIEVLDGWRAEALILVEGLFDALSLASCGWSCVATIGRWAPWLPDVSRGRVVWLAFDAGRPGEAEAKRCSDRLTGAEVRRMLPPGRCKDWNTALVKRGPALVSRWVRDCIAKEGRAQ
jgi:hypothetical protein